MNTIEKLKLLRASFALRTDQDVNLDTWVCRTHACLLGHACLMPEFNAMGLVLNAYYGDACPEFKGCYAFEAGAEFFGITHEEADALFISRGESVYDGDCAGGVRDTSEISDRTLALNRLDSFIKQLEG